MKQLFPRDLRAGDIPCKWDSGSASNKLISFSQSVTGIVNSKVVHAGILFDSIYMIEASGGGLHASDLRVQDKNFGYTVFRCTNPNLAAGAGTCAKMMFDIHNAGGALKYNFTGAAASLFGRGGKPASQSAMDDLLTRILAGKTHRFFCTQFVVYVYQFVAEQNGVPASAVFNMADAKMPPGTMVAHMARSGFFTELGYLLPGAR